MKKTKSAKLYCVLQFKRLVWRISILLCHENVSKEMFQLSDELSLYR